MIRKLNVPQIDLEGKDLDTVLETEAASFHVDCVNWPQDFPYAPLCSGRIARTHDALLVDFRVSGLDLRVRNFEDNGSQWEDSCVEFFVQDPDGSCYYNFEINALGKILSCSGADRHHRVCRSPREMEQILRFAQNPTPTAESPADWEGIHAWRVAVQIPFRLIGVNPERLPASLKANFYKCGDLTAHPHYLSWSPVGTATPDFHRPEFFGELTLQ